MKTKTKSNYQTLFATSGSAVKEFITRKEFISDEVVERRIGHESQFGYITALIDGYLSDGNKRVVFFKIA
jgi:hypothetical protein